MSPETLSLPFRTLEKVAMEIPVFFDISLKVGTQIILQFL